MAGVAYLLPPISGFLAYLWGREQRVRFHGLQSVILGGLTPALLYGASALSATATRAVAAVAAAAWLVLFAGTAIGRNPRLPFVGKAVERLTRDLRTSGETHST